VNLVHLIVPQEYSLFNGPLELEEPLIGVHAEMNYLYNFITNIPQKDLIVSWVCASVPKYG